MVVAAPLFRCVFLRASESGIFDDERERELIIDRNLMPEKGRRRNVFVVNLRKKISWLFFPSDTNE
jgi:hypothetical protein